MIEDYHFGSMTIGGRSYQADIKIIDGRVVNDWWRQQAHVLGVLDVDDILAAAPEILIVGMGQPGMMRVAETLQVTLAARGIELAEEPTAKAVQSFNKLYLEGKRVAAAFHLTC
jgi:hypothetical protein